MVRDYGKFIVSNSVFVEKGKVTVGSLVVALFYDVSGNKDYKIPKDGEKRDRELSDIIAKAKKSVAFFIDEAHDLHHTTLINLNRIMENVRHGGGKLSIIMARHPKLKNDLDNHKMEEIGHRTCGSTSKFRRGCTFE